MLGFAIRRERQDYRLEAELFAQPHEIGHHLRVVIAGERILHHQHGARFFGFGEAFQLLQRHARATMPHQLLLQRRRGEQRQVDHADMPFRERTHPRLTHKEVKGFRRASHQRRVAFHRRNQVVAHRAQIARVVKLQKARAEFRHVDFNRALRRAGFTGETAAHRLFHLVREIVFAAIGVPAVAGALNERAQAGALLRQRFFERQRVHATVGEQPQPLAHQRRAPFRRVNAIAGDFHRRAHRAFHIKVKAQAVTVALHRAAPGGAHRERDLTVKRAAFYRIHLHHRRVEAVWRTDFTGVQAVIRVECRLDAPQFVIQRFAEKRRAVFRTKAFAVLAPQQATVAGGERHNLIRDALHQDFLLRIAHIQRRTHMQHACIHMAKHTVAQPVTVQQRAELGDVIGQMLRRNAGVFGKRDRLGEPFGVAEQPDRFFTHRVDTLHAREIPADLPANDAALLLRHKLIEPRAQRFNALVNQRFVIAGEFHDIKTEHRFIRHIGNQLAHRMPDDIFTRQVQHAGIDGFH
ncbi:hypothetical protein BN129_835 [Cronobacter sakazakii 701]|nr:hypothetical protein BN129_835 [Cronobacter sakazakii 701]